MTIRKTSKTAKKSITKTTKSPSAATKSAAPRPTFELKVGLAQMLKGGVIMDVVTPEQAKIAEDAGAADAADAADPADTDTDAADADAYTAAAASVCL